MKSTHWKEVRAALPASEAFDVDLDDGRWLVIEIRLRLDTVSMSDRYRGKSIRTTQPGRGVSWEWRAARILEVLQQLDHVPSALVVRTGGQRIQMKQKVLERLRHEDGAKKWGYDSFRKVWKALQTSGRIALVQQERGRGEVGSEEAPS